ncbi:phage holin family protein [Pseudoalteromonas rubra]|uniref:phage holin family protein n=1 Tax=Pseudoalteromonas rubra TaxID=43658 RepID=UPI002DB8A00D|nr:phage holin family protein [Pseudoalteromonas rubra]MEC4090145.1 phage holin family protein [Pseudoalteromonas rubra]
MLLVANTLICLAIALRTALFVRTGTYRLSIASIAYAITVAAGSDIVLRIYHIAGPPSNADLFFKLIVLVALLRAKGNVAIVLSLKRNHQ